MCCSIRGAVFFLASVHIFFSITQMVYILPVAVSQLGDMLESSMAFIFCIFFFGTGFMTFRGADEESTTLIRVGAISLGLTITFRFILMYFSLLLVETIPEATFLYVYGTSVIPIGFTIILYLLYLAILFCYYKDLKHESSNMSGHNNTTGSSSSRSHHHHQISSPPLNFLQSPRPHLRPHILSSSSSGGGGGGGGGGGRELGLLPPPVIQTINSTP